MIINSLRNKIKMMSAAVLAGSSALANAAGIPTVSGAGNTADWISQGDEWLAAGFGLLVSAVLGWFLINVVMNTVKTYQDTGPDGKSTMVDVGKQALVGLVLGTAIIFILNAVTAIF